METFAFLGNLEVMIILVVALLLFGPEKLKDIGKQLGMAMREMRKMSGEVQRALDLDDLNSGSSGSSYYNGYEAGRWTEPPLTGSAPAGTVSVDTDPLALPAMEQDEGVANGAETISTEAETSAAPGMAHPPGPPALMQERNGAAAGAGAGADKGAVTLAVSEEPAAEAAAGGKIA